MNSTETEPLWSVMIPVCNRLTYLRETIDSVLCQAPSEAEMEICIVDNSTDSLDWKDFLSEDELKRISIIKTRKHLSLYENHNYLIELAKGKLLHILHDDDFIHNGFYNVINNMACKFPQVALLATRCYYVNEEGHVIGETPRLLHLENSSHDPQDLFIDNNIQFPGVVLRKNFYLTNGGFDLNLKYCSDWSMWVKAISTGGAIASPDLLASYRIHSNSGSNTLMQTAKNLEEREAFCRRMEQQFPNYPCQLAYERIGELARMQADFFWLNGNYNAAIKNEEFIYRRLSLKEKFKWQLNRALSKAKKYKP
jgi:glycosyltransferase involved in cell wall biosynthesis